MKIVFVGGGSHRYLGVARSILASPQLMEQGDINLYDPAVQRAEAVGRLIEKSPEYAAANCRVVWNSTLDEALEGADVVMVVLMAGSAANHGLLEAACRHHNFVGSDQLSPSGAMLALKGGPILMDLARRMERLCPDAWLVDFANPVAGLSAAVNNHTRIRCLGVCEGYQNHQWDLSRLLYGRDERLDCYEVLSAGVNHLAFILPGSKANGRDIYELAAERLTASWRMPVLASRWDEAAAANITRSAQLLVAYYRKYGYLVFSSEGDGLAHLDVEGSLIPRDTRETPPTPEEMEARRMAGLAQRQTANAAFAAFLDRTLDEADWNVARPDNGILQRVDGDVMVRIVQALGGEQDISIATSFPNKGAVQGFKDCTVLEYSQLLGPAGLRPAASLEVPDLFQGLIGSLATHQTLLGDAIATRDPRLLFEALYNYPEQRDTAPSKTLWRELLSLAAPEIPAEFAAARAYFCA